MTTKFPISIFSNKRKSRSLSLSWPVDDSKQLNRIFPINQLSYICINKQTDESQTINTFHHPTRENASQRVRLICVCIIRYISYKTFHMKNTLISSFLYMIHVIIMIIKLYVCDYYIIKKRTKAVVFPIWITNYEKDNETWNADECKWLNDKMCV
jgi:hypothetical protein